MIDIVNGKHILQVEGMKNLLKENDALKQKLQKYVEEDFVKKSAKNSNMQWPKNLSIYYRVQEVPGIREIRKKLEILHEGLVPQRRNFDYLAWLTKRVTAAWERAECDRWLMNHLAYFPESKFSRMTVGMEVRCPHCNQYFLANSMKKHIHRCPNRVFTVWNKAGYTIPHSKAREVRSSTFASSAENKIQTSRKLSPTFSDTTMNTCKGSIWTRS